MSKEPPFLLHLQACMFSTSSSRTHVGASETIGWHRQGLFSLCWCVSFSLVDMLYEHLVVWNVSFVLLSICIYSWFIWLFTLHSIEATLVFNKSCQLNQKIFSFRHISPTPEAQALIEETYLRFGLKRAFFFRFFLKETLAGNLQKIVDVFFGLAARFLSL